MQFHLGVGSCRLEGRSTKNGPNEEVAKVFQLKKCLRYFQMEKSFLLEAEKDELAREVEKTRDEKPFPSCPHPHREGDDVELL